MNKCNILGRVDNQPTYNIDGDISTTNTSCQVIHYASVDSTIIGVEIRDRDTGSNFIFRETIPSTVGHPLIVKYSSRVHVFYHTGEGEGTGSSIERRRQSEGGRGL